ncbi:MULTISPECIES: enoyl-CoA hydratase-related protein [unclassified Pseudomonas]|uniref:enoyl-CoA hydratase-related protein n=1 Tax=unclassified Pseudomonas TaxID=196821 RepID=UPI00244B52D8|nr:MULTISPECIES: enoyl-CoA hydratase-related protein [unclassified Pseudomonas]MDH0301692.1 enoyl-CoA hydratase-related protein [Pseudomonas sp. GD04091]MDH1984911.1 enoyl-CoA hydratase-related protein [Pseudomonas sp. GD03689]
MTELIVQDLDQGLLTLTFNRPDKLNALNLAMYQQLAECLLAADDDPRVQVILVTGGPSCFTAGNDLRDFLDHPPQGMDSPVFRLMQVVIALDKPLIAAVCGPAIGIGTTLLLHCDQVLVSRSARLRMPFVPLGLSPEFGASLLLPRLLGHARAAELLLGNAVLDGQQAVAWGLANALHEEGEQCLTAARRRARELQAMPQGALRASRRLLREDLRVQLQTTLRRECRLFIERLGTAEARMALSRLLEA